MIGEEPRIILLCFWTASATSLQLPFPGFVPRFTNSDRVVAVTDIDG